ncbi:MAG: DUF1684 domain-containing protein [Luteimonas sp.]
MSKLQLLLATCLALAVLAGCQRDGEKGVHVEPVANKAAASFAMTEQAWREQRRKDLLAPDGWTSLIGLHWIDTGSHDLGSAAGNEIQLSLGPPHMGVLEFKQGSVRLLPDPSAKLTIDGVPVEAGVVLRTDTAAGGPSVIGFDAGKGAATVIERAGRTALRVKHADAPARLQFAGLDYWPADPAWKIEGRFVAHPPGTTMDIANIIGSVDSTANPGVIEFTHDGKPYRLEALDEGEGKLFLVFADRTNGKGSYGAGRFLYAPMPDKDQRVVLDFNQSYNPPCAFTTFATCPLPPPENRLDLAITSGEKAYRKPPHS